jgi:hypothetical protein
MLNEPFMRAVVAEKARQRDDLARLHRLRLSVPAPARRRARLTIHIPRPSWPWRSWRRAQERRDRAAVPQPRPALRCVRDDVFAP